MPIEKISILVTGVGGGSVGEQIIFALRLSKYRYKIITVDHNPFSSGLYSADKSYLVPSATEKSYLNKLLEICKKESVKALIPGSDIELLLISQNQDLFQNENILPLINSKDVINICRNKWKTYLFLKNSGFYVPKSYLWNEDNHMNKIDYPVIVKPYLETGGSRFIFIAQNNEELSFFCRYIKKQGSEPMVQKYVESGDSEYTVEVLTSFEGELLGSIAIKRRLQDRLSTLYSLKNYEQNSQSLYVSTGISQGIIDDFHNIRKVSEKIALKINSKGPINIQCRESENRVYVFEINPRFSGTESLRALAGFNAPDSLIKKYILGENIKKLSYKKGIVSRGLNNSFINFEEYNKFISINKNNL